MKQDINKYHNAQSIIDIFKIYFDQEEKIYLILKDLSVGCRKFIKRWNNKRALLRRLLSGTTLSQYSVDVDSDENKKILQVRYLNELPSLINDLHLLL